ncbi:ankyrin repeat [Stylonychia lemnae]|uniref:Ankyrin repeat n=1 Tax=Stylonychia lemnae TaxID=5949 RepID=A0A078A8D9_STYLE|nr:ankyrin repeat [Stylonychia lemnae]|eukprot:CDW78136.1 ankyrin repeat [Stylonychia lemnae]
MDFLVKKYFGANQTLLPKSLEQATDVLNSYCQLESLDQVHQSYKVFDPINLQDDLIGAERYVRENQLISASACSSFKSSMYVKEALSGINSRILDKVNLVTDQISGNIRTTALTPLMVAYRAKGGNNALLYACNNQSALEGENYLLVKYLIDEAGADPNIMNDTFRNALLLATKRNQLNVVDLLIKKNVDINVTDNNFCNALHLAASGGFLEMCETILLHRAKVLRLDKSAMVFDIDGEDSLSLTPLMKASINGHLEIVKLLLKFGANPRKKNKRSESSLALACMQENAAICDRLIIAKADVNEVDFRKRTPLLKCARHNSQSVILQMLLKAGARTDIADDEGNTPLHFAAMRGTIEVGQFLINLGANPYSRNRKGFVPYELTGRDDVKAAFMVCALCTRSSLNNGNLVGYMMQCNHCFVVRYCDIECQKKDWQNHKKVCENFKKRLPGGIGLI